MKKVVIFGSTGSIGKQSLEVIQKIGLKVLALTAFKSEELLREQAKQHKAKIFLGNLSSEKTQELVSDADYVINAVPGFEGLNVSVQALKAGKVLLSANKESLAIAGKYLKQIARENNAEIRPLDSEAFATWQLLNKYGFENLSSVTLTCSGGPFFGRKSLELSEVTVEEALNHPTWKMGPKVSLDSATLINKVFEVFEISNLFDLPLSMINIVIHRQSLVHGIIHTKTGATKMQINKNDMRLPIFFALMHPESPKSPWPHYANTRKSELAFDKPDAETFRSIKWLELHRGNPNFPIVLNAMNDIATKRFLNGEIKFLEIYDFIEEGFEKFLWEVPPKSLDELITFHNRINDFYEHSNIAGGRKVAAC